MEDTVTLARQEREKQGPWEVEVSYGGEADLHRHEGGCVKNPGHQKFVPVDQFNVDHLPPGCQDNDLVDLVKAVSHLTVRVSVKYVSEGRPETDPESGKPYPCYKNRGSDMMRVGTGWVSDVAIYPDVNKPYKTCSCQECLISPTPKSQFAVINIATAAHVVYDSLEAAHTTCHLFFDKGGTPETCSGVVTLTGGSVGVMKIDEDWCWISFLTHDLDLAMKLKNMANHGTRLRKRYMRKLGRPETGKHKSSSAVENIPAALAILHERLKEKYDRLDTGKHKLSSPLDDVPALDDLTIIVSHPHGCSKQVSVDYCVDRKKTWRGMYPLRYNTATCPGSSGARVLWLKGELCGIYWGYGGVHSGNCEENNNMNYCSHYRI